MSSHNSSGTSGLAMESSVTGAGRPAATTCISPKGRNRSFGERIGRGQRARREDPPFVRHGHRRRVVAGGGRKADLPVEHDRIHVEHVARHELLEHQIVACAAGIGGGQGLRHGRLRRNLNGGRFWRSQ